MFPVSPSWYHRLQVLNVCVCENQDLILTDISVGGILLFTVKY